MMSRFIIRMICYHLPYGGNDLLVFRDLIKRRRYRGLKHNDRQQLADRSEMRRHHFAGLVEPAQEMSEVVGKGLNPCCGFDLTPDVHGVQGMIAFVTVDLIRVKQHFTWQVNARLTKSY